MDNQQTAVVIQRTIQGLTTRDIGQEIGLSRTAVNNVQHRPEVKAKIERAANHIINRGLQPAVKTLCRLAAMGNVKDADKDSLKLSLDASKHITSMAGLSGTAPSTIINAMIQINQAPEQAQELNTIAAFLSSQWQQPEQPAIDIQSKVDIKYPAEQSELDRMYPDDEESVKNVNSEIGIPTPHTAGPDIIDISSQPAAGDAPGSCHDQPKTEANGQP